MKVKKMSMTAGAHDSGFIIKITLPYETNIINSPGELHKLKDWIEKNLFQEEPQDG